MPLRSQISDFEWKFVLGAIITIDAIQFFASGLVLGLVGNRFADIVIGLGIAGYLKMRGYSLDGNDWLVLAFSFLGEEVSFLVIDIAPFWTYDIWRFMNKDKMRPAA